MPVVFCGSKIIPAPKINIVKNYLYSQDNTAIGSTFEISIEGQIVVHEGSPSAITEIGSPPNNVYFYDQTGYPSGEVITSDNQNLGRVLRKIEHLRQLFSDQNNNGLLEIYSADGSAPMKMNFRIGSLSFPSDRDISWFNIVNYSITGFTEVIYVNGTEFGEDSFSEYISSAEESWSVDTLEDQPEGLYGNLQRTYRLTHSISAVGRRVYDINGDLIAPTYENARNYVLPRMGIDSYFTNSSGVKDLPSTYQALNHIVNENIDKLGGGYSITETWILASGKALEDFSVSTNGSLQDGLTSVSINGTITGLELRDANQNVLSYKIDNAEDKFSAISGIIYSRAQTYSNTSLNMIPISTTIGKNPITGIINYDYQYNNRPTNFVSGARSESIEIIDDFGGSIVAAISVPYRTNGPVLQDIGTKKESTRTLSVELILGPQSSLDVPTSINSDVSSLISQASPQGVYQSFLVDNTQSWNPKEGRLSITKTWLYEA